MTGESATSGDGISQSETEYYTVELTEGELERVLMALTVYANEVGEPTDGITRQLGSMIAQTAEPKEEAQ